MPSVIITEDTVSQAILNDDGQYALILPNGVLRNNFVTISVLPTFSASVLNYGLVFSESTLMAAATGSAFTLRNLGDMMGRSDGIQVNGARYAGVVNTGSIQAGIEAFAVFRSEPGTTDVQIQNDGLIAGFVGVALDQVAILSFLNTGTISGGDRGVLMSNLASEATIVNSGTIAGTVALQLLGGTVGLTVLNSGLLDGAVRLGGGADLLDSRDGTTTGLVEGLGGDDTLIAGTAFRAFDGGIGNDVLTGGAGADLLLGGAGLDEIDGGEGNDVVRGGAGADVLEGGLGRDLLDYALSLGVNVNLATGDALFADAAGDAFTGFENLAGGSGKDTLTGDAGVNVLYGRSFDDLLSGGGGNDHLLGQDGNDTLDGGLGGDILRGGLGADRFRLTAVANSPNVAGQRDRILDHVRAEGDRIDLSAIDTSTILPDDQAFTFVTGNFTGAWQVRAFASGGTWVVQGNTDATTTTVEFAIFVTTAVALNATDFVL
jgi:Ca2+-binding RTX toxin-like protein